MDWACGTNGEDKKCGQHASPKTWKKREHLENLDLSKIILKWFLKTVWHDGD
jgi:hypothetical protein